jgi:hypothetical protein
VSEGASVRQRNPNLRFRTKLSKLNPGNRREGQSFETLVGTPKNERKPFLKQPSRARIWLLSLINSTPYSEDRSKEVTKRKRSFKLEICSLLAS